MTRIVIDPDELIKVARFITEAADDYEHKAREIGTRTLPPMPAPVAAAVASELGAVTTSLGNTAARLQTEAVMLRLRAAIFSSGAGTAAVGGLLSFAGSLGTVTDSDA